jgi:hypothetical protein
VRPFVPESFLAPPTYESGRLRLELLGPQHNAADHAAWISSIPHIRATPGFGGGWPPPDGMTLAENLVDLHSHAERSARRADFAYSVLDRATGDVVGCVYLKPSADGALVSSWVTAARADLDGPLTGVVRDWLAAAWPFEVVRYR